MTTTRLARSAAGVLVAAAALAACATTTTSPHHGGGATVTVTDGQKGARVTVHVGQGLIVALGSTYWTIDASPDQRVLKTDGAQAVQPVLKGCVPGGGCGTAVRHFDASAPGTVRLTASRLSCGEALRCTGGTGTFDVTVVVRS
jgi:hypothetical protein